MVIVIVMMNFNSIKVRLNRTTRVLPTPRLRFQFHKGTIKPTSGRNHVTVKRNFNSIKVRLNQSVDITVNYQKAEFQFHKGTIKPFNVAHTEKFVQKFQFHKGTIKPSSLLI